tara:strand:+ start:461 stop:1801 length:1341 start_codon:yes stop_codon:yes gene_type:complete
MASINGLTNIAATSIQNAGEFYLGNNIDPGTAGQVIISAGSNQPAVWGSNAATLPGALTMGTNLSLASGNASFNGATPDTINASGLSITGGNGISIVGGTEILTDNDNTTINNSGGTGQQNQVLKVPNALTSGTGIGFSAGTTYDGSAAITINSTATDTTYQGSSTINIDTSTNPDTINALKVPNVMTASSNIIFNNTDDGASETTYDGSQPITIRAVDTNTTYQGGTNISIDTTTNPDTINLDANIGLSMINPVTIIAFQQHSGATALIGNALANPYYGTDVTYLDLSSTTNITSPYCFHNVYGTASTDFDSLTTSYAAGSILGALGASITAKQTALCVEVIVYNYAISSNRDTDMRLVDKAGSEWSVGTTEGGSGTGTIQTAREVHRADETDRQIVHQTWSITGLTIGSTYTFNPQARTSATSNFLAAGGTYPDAFFRGYYLPS